MSKGGSGFGGFGNMVKQAQQMQVRIQKVQTEMAEKTIEATAGGGMVTAVANGKHELISVKINKEVVNPNDVEMLEDISVIGRDEGLFVAPEGAATLSALKKLLASGFIEEQDEVVLFNTGSGLKYCHLF